MSAGRPFASPMSQNNQNNKLLQNNQNNNTCNAHTRTCIHTLQENEKTLREDIVQARAEIKVERERADSRERVLRAEMDREKALFDEKMKSLRSGTCHTC
jgi:hypothetical protein